MVAADEILIVEDSAMQAKRLKKLLTEHGYTVFHATDGQEGLQLASEKRPLLIVSDIVMPRMDGYEMCRTLKSDDSLKAIPIILLTSLSNPEDVFLGLQSGADSYISKPYEPATLIKRIKSIIAGHRLPRLRNEDGALEVVVSGKTYVIDSSREKILGLLLSTYQDAVEQNHNLREVRTKLVMANEKLEKLVAARTEALNREITERRRIEEALASEKERLSVLLHSVTDGVITTNTEGKIVFMNRSAEELTGWSQEEAVGEALTTVFTLVKSSTYESGETVMENILTTGGLIGLEEDIALLTRDGNNVMVTCSGTPIFDKTNIIIGVVLVFRDVSTTKRVQEELNKAQKLESLGVLAGGIAHDFNNLLTAILGNVSLAKVYAQNNEKVTMRLQEAEKASLRAKDLTQQLLTFSKGGAPVKKTASLVEIVKDSARFALRGSNIKCEFYIPKDLWAVEIDEGQISQVIHNLIINAGQAMAQGGVIRIKATNIRVTLNHDLSAGLKPSKYVELRIIDEGHGISQKLLTKIFDPYFTTKSKGSGLGLATCYSILKNHDGAITVDSAKGVGSVFSIYLPIAQKNELPVPEHRDGVICGQGRILVMDDEEILRNFVGDLLMMLGYEVSFAADGLEAISAYCQALKQNTPFDCVLMDLTIPGGMGGKEAIRKLREINPEVRAIVSSGYSDDPVMANHELYGFCGVVAKPYDAEQLSEVLHKALSTNGGKSCINAESKK